MPYFCMGRLQSLEWTSRLDWWTGLVDWTDGLTLKIIFILSNGTHLCDCVFLATHMAPEQINHYPTVFMRVFVPSINGFLHYDVL